MAEEGTKEGTAKETSVILPLLVILGLAGVGTWALMRGAAAAPRIAEHKRLKEALASPLASTSDESAAQRIARAYPQVSIELARRAVQVARHIGAQPNDLANLIYFESKWNPRARNKTPPHATGLIQFVPRTAEELGTTINTIRRMSALQQMEYVERYFDMVRRGQSLNTPHKLYMAVFYRKAIGWDPQQRFSDKVIANNTFTTAGGRRVSITTPAIYVAEANRIAKMPVSTSTASTNTAVAGTGFGAPRALGV